MNNQQLKLDKLDIKFLEEFPLIMDVFTVTLSRMGGLLDTQFEAIKKIIETAIATKKGWSLSKKSVKGVHQIFSVTSKLIELSPYYHLKYELKIIKGSEDKLKNLFYCLCGFYYDKEEYDNKLLMYYAIQKESLEKNSNFEYFEIYTIELTDVSINKTFHFYCENVLKKYLRQLKW